jgi:hypothetical protein
MSGRLSAYVCMYIQYLYSSFIAIVIHFGPPAQNPGNENLKLCPIIINRVFSPDPMDYLAFDIVLSAINDNVRRNTGILLFWKIEKGHNV